MPQLLWNDRPLSRMMLGTVQFGMPYGIANRTGQPDYSLVLDILRAAVDGGVNALDTAAAYGSSEEILGRALRELGFAPELFIVTKVRPLSPEELADPRLGAAAVEDSVAQSLRRLQLETLPAVLFHREADAVYNHVLHSLVERGLIRHAGVSCNNFPGPAGEFATSGLVSALQIPANILDRRHRTGGIFELAVERSIAIFIRSVYLQGLLVMPPEDIPPHLQAVLPFRQQLESLAQQAGLQLPELALRYMLAQPGITSLLTGVETLPQIRDNLALFARGPLPPDLVAAVDALPLDPPQLIITPSEWNPPPA